MNYDMDWADPVKAEQNTGSWLRWRHQGLGASDGPILMEKSPFKTRYQLWVEKTQPEPPSGFSNWATERGHRVEPIVREMLEKDFGPITTKTMEKGELRCSLDGINEKETIAFEIKVPGEKDHKDALENKVPEKYWHQLMHQFYVSGVESIVYASYYLKKGQDETDGELACVVLNKDDYISEIGAYALEAKKFWQLVKDKTPPPLGDKDWAVIDDDELLKTKLEAYKFLSFEADIMKQKVELLKEEIIAHCVSKNYRKVKCTGVSISEVTRKGAVNYKKIKQLEGVDLEEFRGKSSSYYKVSVDK